MGSQVLSLIHNKKDFHNTSASNKRDRCDNYLSIFHQFLEIHGLFLSLSPAILNNRQVVV